MGTLRGRTILPMKAVTGELPISRAGGDPWAYEIKWDGMRVVALLDDDGLRLKSAAGNDATIAYPELAGLTSLLDGFESIVLDGEVVAMDESGVPSFAALQHRMHISNPKEATARAQETPVTFAIFDLLHLDGHDTTSLPLKDRRKLLEQIVDEPGSHWRLTDQTLDDPHLLLATVREQGLEGIVAKRLDSTYQPGKSHRHWVKVKPSRRQEFVVGGWTEGRDGNAGGLGSLLLGVTEPGPQGGELVPAGSVGSGLNDRERQWWKEQLELDVVDESPFASPVRGHGRTLHWSQPTHVIEVAFGEWTEDGHLRHPVYLGRRNDKDPADVVREV